MLIRIRPVQAAAEIVRVVKTNSSRWVHEKWDKRFAWQTGYGAFSVSESNVSTVSRYIATQEEHHKTRTFQEEYVAFLKKNKIPYERAVHLGLVSFAPPGLVRVFWERSLPAAATRRKNAAHGASRG